MTQEEFPADIVDIDGVPTRVTSWMGDRQVTLDEWNLAYCTNGVTLRAACKGEELPVSGTNADRARRLVEAGLTRDEVERRYGGRARRG